MTTLHTHIFADEPDVKVTIHAAYDIPEKTQEVELPLDLTEQVEQEEEFEK